MELRANKRSNLADFTKQDQIANGSFGKVYKVLEKSTGIIYAAKILNDYIDCETRQLSIDISREVDILSKLDHPTVLKFMYFSPFNFKNERRPVIITELASNGTLGDFIEMERLGQPKLGWTITRKLIIAYGISSAMSYLHKHDIIHRDLKPDNILMDEFLIPKIADFGLSKTLNNENSLFQSSNCIKGTPKYISPEIWERNEYSKMSDVYAFGLILYEICTGERLFENCSYFNIISMINNGYRPPFNKKIPDAYKDLIERCWRQIPYARPTFNQIADDLKTDKKYITKNVDEEEFYSFVKYIDEYESTFGKKKKYYQILKKTDNREIKEFKAKVQFGLKLFPFREYIKLKEKESIELVHEAETNPEKQFIIGKCLIDGENDFPRNVQLGIKYLKHSFIEESIIYYIKMLIKGEVIPLYLKKAKKLIDEKLKHTKSIYSLLYGKLYKKQRLYKQAIISFKESIKEGNAESMFEYGKMLIKTKETLNIEEGIQYLKMAIEKKFIPAMYKYGKYLFKSDDENDNIIGEKLIQKAASLNNIKAQYLYGKILFNKNKINESAPYFKESSRKGYIKSMHRYGTYIYYFGPKKFTLDASQKALLLYKKAADRGDVLSLFRYCKLLPKSDEFVKCIRITANNGIVEAMKKYGYMLRNGELVPVDMEEAVKYYKMAADNGNPSAMNDYAYMMENGEGVSVNYDEAIKYYKMAIEKGISEAMHNYAKMLEDGKGISTNFDEANKYYNMAIKYLKMAIDKGNIFAMHNYATMLENGNGIAVNYEEAIKYYKMAADNGYSKAMNNYAYMLQNGKGVAVNLEEAAKYYKMAADKGEALSMSNYACMLEKGAGVSINYEEAIKYLKMAIDKGNSDAMNNYAIMLENGEGVSANYEEATKYYKMAIEKGNSDAMNNYAYMMHANEGVPVNYEEAIKYYKMAIEKGNASAMNNYAFLLEKGIGVPVNKEEAIKYYKMAIDKNDSDAMFNYANMMQNGEIVNYKEAIKYYKMAIKEGNTSAMNNYAYMLEKGQGVTVNYKEAIKYYKMAISEGVGTSMFHYAEMIQNGKGVDVNIDEAIRYYKLAIRFGEKRAKEPLSNLLAK